MTENLTRKVDGIWLVLPYGQPVTNADGIQASYDTVMLWEEGGEDWNSFDLARPDPLPSPPEGKVETGRELVDDHGRPAWAVTYADAPPPVAPVTQLYKADIWRRCTDDEATTLNALLGQQTIRVQRIFADATLLRSDDELFGMLQGAVTQLLGAERAAEILAPS